MPVSYAYGAVMRIIQSLPLRAAQWRAAFASLCVMLCSTPFAAAQSDAPVLRTGEITAPDWSYSDDPPLEIIGEWEVVWGQLLEPGEFDAAFEEEHFTLPARWNNLDKTGIDGAFGVATFRARLDLPAYDRALSFHLIAPHAAYRIYVNGVAVVDNGKVAASIDGFVPNYVSRSFPAQSGQSELVFQVANFSHAYGGPGHALTLWEATQLRQTLNWLSVIYGLVLGIMFSIGLFHFILYLADRKNPPSSAIHLWFAVLCFIICYRVQGVVPLLHEYYPHADWWWGDLRGTYLSLYAAPAVYLLFFRSVFAEYFPKRFTQAFIGVSLAGLIFTLVAPPFLYTLTRNFSIFLNVSAIAFSLIITVRAAYTRQDGAVTILISNFLFLLTAVNDALIYTDQVSGFDMTPFGILALGLGYSYALLLRLQNRFKTARDASIALEALNLGLEQEVRDRTRAFKAAASKAERAAEERARFIAAASHDLRQPLHALAMFNAALKRKIGSKTEASLVEQQESAIANMGGLLQDTLDTARIDVQQKTPEYRVIDVESIFETLSKNFQNQAKARKVELELHAVAQSITTDAFMLQRIMSNLIDNALKAARTRVSVEAAVDEGEWIFKVSDDGTGISGEDTQRIFDSYVSLDHGEDDTKGGYGLGLYVVKEFTKLLGGRISVSSNINAGSQFKLALPNLQYIEQKKEPALTPFVIESRLKGRCVLALDDEIDVLSAMTVLLESWGCKVAIAATPDAAIKHIRGGFLPDIILADYHLHGVTGLSASHQIAAILPVSVPVIIITGATEPEIVGRVEGAGMDILEKPVEPQVLAHKMIVLLDAE